MMDPSSVAHLLDLIALPETGQLIEELQRWEGAARLGSMPSHALEPNLKHARNKVTLGTERDEILAARPAGCWCMGIGGRQVYWHVDEGLYECRGGYCPCDDGRRVEAAARELLERLSAERRALQIEQLVQEVSFPRRLREATFESYPAHRQTKATFNLVRDWASDAEHKYLNSLFLWGPTGSGKTGLAVAALKTVIRETGDEGFFWTVSGLLTDIKRRFNGGGADALVQSISEAPLLVLDDLGVEKPSDWTREILFQVINTRHSDDSLTIITSNLSLERLVDEKHLDERLAWRIVEMCEVAELSGPNLRDRSLIVIDPEAENAIEEAAAIVKKGGAS